MEKEKEQEFLCDVLLLCEPHLSRFSCTHKKTTNGRKLPSDGAGGMTHLGAYHC